jgi:hypothetical protein
LPSIDPRAVVFQLVTLALSTKGHLPPFSADSMSRLTAAKADPEYELKTLKSCNPPATCDLFLDSHHSSNRQDRMNNTALSAFSTMASHPASCTSSIMRLIVIRLRDSDQAAR